jgi:hypothetical protein
MGKIVEEARELPPARGILPIKNFVSLLYY